MGVVAALVALGGCGRGDGSDEASTATALATLPATTTTTTVRATTSSTTTSTTTTTSSTTTTTSTSTTTTTTATSTTTSTLPPLPDPVAPPKDDDPEPVLELGTIEIPRLGLVRTISEGIRLSTLDRGPGHWPGTAMPGAVGNAVFAGHRVSHNEDFRDLDQLQPGDEVVMDGVFGRHVYRVVSIEIVAPDAMWIVDQTYERTATLFACHPPGSIAERIVVHLRLA